MKLEGIALKGYREICPDDRYPAYKGYPWIEPINLPSKCPKCQTTLLDSAGNPTDELGYDEQKPPKKIKDIKDGKYDVFGNYIKFKDRIREIVLFRQRYKCKACGKRFFAETPEIDSQLRYTKRFLDAVAAYALQYGYTGRAVQETGLSTSSLTKYVNDAIEQKYLNRRWHGARTIALYTQKFSASEREPSKSLLYFCICSLDGTAFFTDNLRPATCPICFPLSLAVNIPSLVRWCRSSTSFCACTNASLICSFARATVY